MLSRRVFAAALSSSQDSVQASPRPQHNHGDLMCWHLRDASVNAPPAAVVEAQRVLK